MPWTCRDLCMMLGYARVCTDKQDLSSQMSRLKQAGAERIYQDVISGKRFDRPGLTEMMAFAREGDTLGTGKVQGASANSLSVMPSFTQNKGEVAW
jgi:hypothetical protein